MKTKKKAESKPPVAATGKALVAKVTGKAAPVAKVTGKAPVAATGKAPADETTTATTASTDSQHIQATALISPPKYAKPPVKLPPLISVVAPTLETGAANQENNAPTDRQATFEETIEAIGVAKEVDAEVTATGEEPADRVERLAAQSAKLTKRPIGTPKPEGTVHDALLKAKFMFINTAEPDRDRERGIWIHGYQHTDGRAAAYSFTLDDHIPSKLTLLYPYGRQVEDAEALRHVAMNRRDRDAEKSRWNRQQNGLAQTAARSRKAVEEGHDVMSDIERRLNAPPTTPEAVCGLPANVVRAVEMLGGLTLQRFDLTLLRGDKYYGKRMALLKRLFNRDRVLAKECGINNLVEAFYSAVGAGEGRSAAAQATEFANRCKEISKKMRVVKAAKTREEKKQLAAIKRDTLLERTVPGKILPVYKPLNRKQQAAQDAEDRAYVFALAASAEHYPTPRPEAEISLNLEDVRLLEDPGNGIPLMQIERANSQGAICVYNNGVRVACGVVPTETLKRLRPIPQDLTGLGTAATQLLNPINVSVPVTPVALRHLTAVLEACKEKQAMTAAATVSVTKHSKFAPPAKKAGKPQLVKAAKAEKPAKAAKAEKAERAPRAVADRAITHLKKKNELREGTFCHAQVNAALSSKTVSEAQAKLDKDKTNPNSGRKIEIGWLVKQGYIKVA